MSVHNEIKSLSARLQTISSFSVNANQNINEDSNMLINNENEISNQPD